MEQALGAPLLPVSSNVVNRPRKAPCGGRQETPVAYAADEARRYGGRPGERRLRSLLRLGVAVLFLLACGLALMASSGRDGSIAGGTSAGARTLRPAVYQGYVQTLASIAAVGSWAGGGAAATAVPGAGDASKSAWLPPPWVGEPAPLDPMACTPQLVIVGVPRGGSTTMYGYLNGTVPSMHYANMVHFTNGTPASREYLEAFQRLPDEERRYHPALVGSFLKEAQVFGSDDAALRDKALMFPGVDPAKDSPLEGKCSYARLYGLRPSNRPALVRFEATPTYFSTESAVVQMWRHVPNSRFVALLREPVGRALSHINMLAQSLTASMGIDLAADDTLWANYIMQQLSWEMDIIDTCKSKVLQYSEVPAYRQIDSCMDQLLQQQPANSTVRRGIMSKGLYDLHLQRWFDHFHPNQTLIWSSKAFGETPKQHLQQLVHWLDLEPSHINHKLELVTVHEGKYPTGRPLPTWFMEEMIKFYEPHKEQALNLMVQHGYHEAAVQMRQAWVMELQSTVERLVAPGADTGDTAAEAASAAANAAAGVADAAAAAAAAIQQPAIGYGMLPPLGEAAEQEDVLPFTVQLQQEQQQQEQQSSAARADLFSFSVGEPATPPEDAATSQQHQQQLSVTSHQQLAGTRMRSSTPLNLEMLAELQKAILATGGDNLDEGFEVPFNSFDQPDTWVDDTNDPAAWIEDVGASNGGIAWVDDSDDWITDSEGTSNDYHYSTDAWPKPQY